MAWIELHQNLPAHPKLSRLAARLRVRKTEAAGCLVFLWLWALEYAEDGDLEGLSAVEIADAAQFRGNPEAFVAALVEARWLDPGQRIHDWDDYAGRAVDMRERNRRRKAESRARIAAMTGARRPRDVTVTDPGRPRDVTVTTDVTHGDVSVNIETTKPNQTRPNQTRPNQTPEGEAPSSTPTLPGMSPPSPETVRSAAAPPHSGEPKSFRRPSIEDLLAYAAEIKLAQEEVASFFDHFTSNGWRVGGRAPMKDWKAALRRWQAQSVRKKPAQTAFGLKTQLAAVADLIRDHPANPDQPGFFDSAAVSEERRKDFSQLRRKEGELRRALANL